jgi:ATP-dependent helicase HepA
MVQVDEFMPGDRVGHAADSGRTGIVIGGPHLVSGSVHYEVQWLNPPGMGSVRIEATRLRKLSSRLGMVRQDEFLSHLAVLKLSGTFSDVLFSLGASKTLFRVYQFHPVLQFIQQNSHGLLIADEVGLGKTIEAALILKELIARGEVHRVLVVCPANLREKWRSELRQRFGIELREMRAADFRDLAARVQTEGTWPSFYGVTSLEGLRTSNFQETLEQTGVNFDLVIIDEAHHLRNPATLSFELGEVLSAQSDHILMLSATPVQTGAGDLLSLLKLVDPAQFRGTSTEDLDRLLQPNSYINAALAELSHPSPRPDVVLGHLSRLLETSYGYGLRDNSLLGWWIDELRRSSHLSVDEVVRLRRDLQRLHTLAPYYTRTRRREVEEGAERKAITVAVQLTQAEQDFYDAWVDYLIERNQNLNGSLGPNWGIIQRERQAASCLPAAVQKVADVLRGDGISDLEASDPELRADVTAPLPPVSQSVRAQEAMRQLRDAARAVGTTDSKLDQFLEVVQALLAERPNRKILVFTFFKDTLRHLRRELAAAGVGCISMSGDDPPERRSEIIDYFKGDDGTRILLSTEVGSEGLDFQFCDVVNKLRFAVESDAR